MARLSSTSDITIIVKDLVFEVEKVMKSLSLETTANLRRAPSEGGTPVDTGWARANWVPEVGDSFEGTAGTREEAEAGNLNEAPTTQGLADVVRYKIARGTIYITNNVPYIVILNEGSSKQAPAGFVQGAISAALDVANKGFRGR